MTLTELQKAINKSKGASTAKRRRINLGLAISGCTMQPGDTRTIEEIAAFCGCSKQNISIMERRAVAKFKAAAAKLGYTELDHFI
jgi:hypothetical protein